MLCARTEEGAVPTPGVLLERMAAAVDDVPLLASRLHGAWWTPGSAPPVVVASGDLVESAPLHAFDLRHEPPLRVVTSTQRDGLLLAAHHHAFDGLGMASLLRGLLSGDFEAAPDYTSLSSGHHSSARSALRALRPADPIAPFPRVPLAESMVSTTMVLPRQRVTACLARACAEAAVAHNGAQGRPMRRIGLSVAVGRINGEAATYRRVDVSPDDDVEEAVAPALADAAVPAELKGLPWGAFLLRPVLQRFSDTILLSNLGRLDLPGVKQADFYPVARGRSAVAVGAAGVAGGETTLTVRARNLSQPDSAAFLARIIDALAETRISQAA